MRWLSVLLLVGCAPPRVTAPADLRPLEGEAWFAWRAEALGLSVAEARARDAALPTDAPAEISPPVAEQAAALWASRCAPCHGAEGVPPDRPGMTRPKTWGGFGVRMGFTFGGDSMRAGLYRSISQGKGGVMPSWGAVLAREQIWALVRHVESL